MQCCEAVFVAQVGADATLKDVPHCKDKELLDRRLSTIPGSALGSPDLKRGCRWALTACSYLWRGPGLTLHGLRGALMHLGVACAFGSLPRSPEEPSSK